MPFPYAYYQDNYNGPIHATRFKAKAYVTLPADAITTSGTINATEQSLLRFDTSGSNIIVDGLAGIQNGQIIEVVKMTTANTLTIRNISVVGTGAKFYSSTGSDIVFPPGTLGGTWFIAIQDGALMKLMEIKINTFGLGSQAFPSISFAEDLDTGIFRPSPDSLAVSTGGIERLTVATSFVRSTLQLQASDGTVSLPGLSFANDPDTGFFRNANAVAFTGDGVQRVTFNKTGEVIFSLGRLLSDNPVQFTNTSNLSQRIYTGGVLSSDNYVADVTLVPVNGIYSKGNVRTGGQFIGTATSALYADLAENYESDAQYQPGTVVRLGGSKEITLANNNDAFGVVSTAPGFLLNAEAEGIQLPVALQGKVPCRVIGKIKKGDAVWSCGNGLASIAGNVKIGRALEDKDTEEEGLVMIVTRAVI